MTASVVNQGRRTRQTISASFTLPAGYTTLVAHKGETDTTELNGPWNEEWLGRSTEAKSDARDPLSSRPLTMPELLASGVGSPMLVQRFLTRVLLATSHRPDTTETTESPKACLPDWSKWHELRARAASGRLSSAEADELAMMSEQAKTLDALATDRQADALKPVLQEHHRVLASLAQIAKLLERAIDAAEKPTGLGGTP